MTTPVHGPNRMVPSDRGDTKRTQEQRAADEAVARVEPAERAKFDGPIDASPEVRKMAHKVTAPLDLEAEKKRLAGMKFGEVVRDLQQRRRDDPGFAKLALASNELHAVDPNQLKLYQIYLDRINRDWFSDVESVIPHLFGKPYPKERDAFLLNKGEQATLAQAEALLAELERADAVGNTRLMRAAGMGEWNDVIRLLNNGADPNAQTSFGYTPLHHAVNLGDEYIVKYLLESGADPRRASSDPLVLAAELGRDKIIQLLVDNGSNLNSRTGDHHGTPVLAAVSKRLPTTAQLLIKLGADANIADDEGNIPLVVAMMNEDDASVSALLEAGANANAALASGRTPLIVAAKRGRGDYITQLLAAGADPSVKDKEGHTVFWHAEQFRNPGLLKWVQDAVNAQLHSKEKK
jgi:ankyrin repeat protein